MLRMFVASHSVKPCCFIFFSGGWFQNGQFIHPHHKVVVNKMVKLLGGLFFLEE